MKVGDIVLDLYDRRIGKGEYKLGRVTKVHPDCNGIVRTGTVGFRRTNRCLMKLRLEFRGFVLSVLCKNRVLEVAKKMGQRLRCWTMIGRCQMVKRPSCR